MRPKHFLNFEDFSRQDLSKIIDRAIEIKSKSETSNLFARPNKVSPDLTTIVSNSFKNFCVCLISVSSFNSSSNNEGSKEQACKYKNIENIK